jgi:hypothetical protein
MEKGFKDIEAYFLQAEARRTQEKARRPPQKSRESLITDITQGEVIY